MGFLKSAPERTDVHVVQSTHGQTFIMWPSDILSTGQELPALPLAQQHHQSRQWVMADRTVILILPGNPDIYPGGVIRHTFDVVSSTWRNRTKTLVTLASHPSNPELTFSISTSGVGCACTQGPAGNAGPISEPYKLLMVNTNLPEFDWYTAVTQ